MSSLIFWRYICTGRKFLWVKWRMLPAWEFCLQRRIWYRAKGRSNIQSACCTALCLKLDRQTTSLPPFQIHIDHVRLRVWKLRLLCQMLQEKVPPSLWNLSSVLNQRAHPSDGCESLWTSVSSYPKLQSIEGKKKPTALRTVTILTTVQWALKQTENEGQLVRTLWG